MKMQILGWAVIFAVTILLSACASQEAQVSHTTKMAGPDATLTLTGVQKQPLASMDDTFTYLPPLIEERALQLAQRDFDQLGNADAVFVSDASLDYREAQGQALISQDDTFTYLPPLIEERALQLAQRDFDQAGNADAFLVSDASLDYREAQGQALISQDDTFTYLPPLIEERALQLAQRDFDQLGNAEAVFFSDASLDYREAQEQALISRDDTFTYLPPLMDDRGMQLAQRQSQGIDTTQLVGIDSVPTGAEPGRCYARISVPGEYLTVTDKVLIKPAGTKVEVIPARYETVSKEIMVEKGSMRLKVIPAEYTTVTERVMVEPASKYQVQVPARYEVTLEQVMVTPATTTWKKGAGPIQPVGEGSADILCLVETPAQYQTVSKRVLKSPATTREMEIPAVYEMIERREMTTPAKTVMVEVPAKYKTVQVTKLVAPEHERITPTPDLYQTVTKKSR